jgi:carbon storage regulator
VGESVVLNDNITVTVVSCQNGKVRLGFVAPADVSIHRQEVFEAIHGKNQVLAASSRGVTQVIPGLYGGSRESEAKLLSSPLPARSENVVEEFRPASNPLASEASTDNSTGEADVVGGGEDPAPKSAPPDPQHVGWETIRRDLPRLLREIPGRWVAYRGEQQVALAESHRDLYAQLTKAEVPPNEVVVIRVEPLAPPLDLRRVRRVRGTP